MHKTITNKSFVLETEELGYIMEDTELISADPQKTTFTKDYFTCRYNYLVKETDELTEASEEIDRSGILTFFKESANYMHVRKIYEDAGSLWQVTIWPACWSFLFKTYKEAARFQNIFRDWRSIPWQEFHDKYICAE